MCATIVENVFQKLRDYEKKHSGKTEMSISVTVWLIYILNKILWDTDLQDFTVGGHFNPELSP